jgi:predicted secreted hydrolase
VPSLALRLSERTDLKDQELCEKNGPIPAYWEGAVSYKGEMESKPVSGVGYLEMTGYAKPLGSGGTYR